MDGRLPTGIDVIDRQLEGGFPPGSIVLFSAPPFSQSELFLYEFTAMRSTLYLTTVRSDQAVADAFDRTADQTQIGDPTIREIGVEAPIDQAGKLIGTLSEESTLIIDTINQLEEQDAGQYRYFLNQLQTQLENTNSVAILHGLDGHSVDAGRDLTAQMADLVFDLTTRIQGTEVTSHLSVPKFRGGRALDETIKLKLTAGIEIDTSRDIA